ncbi:recombinase family protein [bacterium]|nr:recombinase family protein [bacterium]
MRVVIYTRRSTDRQAASPQTQETFCREYCEKHDHTVVRVYHEAAITGASEVERRTALPELVALLKDKKRRDFDGVLVWKTDRLMRNPGEQEHLIQLFDRHGVELLSIMDPVDRNTAAGRFMGRVIASANAYEREITGERIYAHHLAAFMRGEWAGGPKSMGLAWNKEKRIFEADNRADDVAAAFQLYVRLNGNASATALELNRIGIASPRGGLWSNGPLLRLLRNPMYRQMLSYDGRRLPAPDRIPRIVSESLTQQADILLDLSRRQFHHFCGHQIGSPRTYSGILFCSECGAVLSSNGAVNQERRWYAGWLCSMKRKHGVCESKQVSVRYLDALIGRAMGILAKHIAKDVENALKRGSVTAKPVKNTQAHRQQKLSDMRRRTVDLYTQGFIDEAEFVSRVTDIDEKIRALSAEEAKQPAPPVSEEVIQALLSIAEHWPTVPDNERRGLLLQIGAEITVNTGKPDPLWIEMQTTIFPKPIRVEGIPSGRNIRIL